MMSGSLKNFERIEKMNFRFPESIDQLICVSFFTIIRVTLGLEMLTFFTMDTHFSAITIESCVTSSSKESYFQINSKYVLFVN